MHYSYMQLILSISEGQFEILDCGIFIYLGVGVGGHKTEYLFRMENFFQKQIVKS